MTKSFSPLIIVKKSIDLLWINCGLMGDSPSMHTLFVYTVFNGCYTGLPMLAITPNQVLEDFVGVEFTDHRILMAACCEVLAWLSVWSEVQMICIWSS